MPIRGFVDDGVFGPETIQDMTIALAAACQALGLQLKDDAATRLLAARIIDLARDGVHDRELLKAAAVRGFKIKHWS